MSASGVVSALDRGHDRQRGQRAALDRISIPQDVLDRIAPTALPRSSLIISDEPLHRETSVWVASLTRRESESTAPPIAEIGAARGRGRAGVLGVNLSEMPLREN